MVKIFITSIITFVPFLFFFIKQNFIDDYFTFPLFKKIIVTVIGPFYVIYDFLFVGYLSNFINKVYGIAICIIIILLTYLFGYLYLKKLDILYLVFYIISIFVWYFCGFLLTLYWHI